MFRFLLLMLLSLPALAQEVAALQTPLPVTDADIALGLLQQLGLPGAIVVSAWFLSRIKFPTIPIRLEGPVKVVVADCQKENPPGE